MKKTVGYLEGTDSIWLTNLNAQGYATLPLSNGFDGHGLNIGMLSTNTRVDVLIGYLHKLLPTEGMDLTPAGLLHAATVYDIPVLVVCSREHQEAGKAMFGEIPLNVRFVDPAGAQAEAEAILGG